MRKLSLIIVFFLAVILSGCLMIPNYNVKTYGNIEVATINGNRTLYSYLPSIGGDVDIKDEYKITHIQSLGTHALGKKYIVTNLTMSKTVSHIMAGAFTGLEVENLYYGGTINDWLKIELYEYSYGGIINEPYILEKCKNLYFLDENGDVLFKGEKYSLVHDLIIPANAKTVNVGTFANIDCLKSIVIEDGVEKIEDCAFKNCKNLESVHISKTVNEIGRETFCECEKLDSLSIEEGIRIIGDEAFKGCICLKNPVIPSTVMVFGKGIFSDCNADTITYGGAFKNIYHGVYLGTMDYYFYPDDACDALLELGHVKYVVLPKSIRKIDVENTDGTSYKDGAEIMFYCGTEYDWDFVFFYKRRYIRPISFNLPIDVPVEPVTENVYFYSEERPLENIENYWHYVDNVPTIWE